MGLENHLKILQDDLDNIKNGSLRKTLIFQNIKQEPLRESWGTTTRIVANDIHRVIRHRFPEEILSKIERVHLPKENQSPVSQHNKISSMIAKFTKWTCTEEIKMSLKQQRIQGTTMTVCLLNVFSSSHKQKE